MRSRVLCLFFLAVAMAAQQQRSPASSLSEKWDFEISGTVVHALSGSPLADVEVLIVPAEKRNEFHKTITSDAGRFSFKGLGSGKYVLAARRRGFPPQPLDGHAGFSTAVAVGPGKESWDLVFRLKPECSISGRVSDEQDEALRGAGVMLFARSVETGERAINLVSQTETDDQGSYHFGHLAAGDYFVAVQGQVWYAQHPPPPANVSSSGNASSTGTGNVPPETNDNTELDVAYPVTYYRDAVEADEASPITLSWGDQLTADVSLRAVPTVHLRIAQDPAFPIENSILKQTLIGGFETSVESFTVSGPDGVEVSGIAPGRYDVVALAKGKSEANPVSRHQVVDASGNVEVDAGKGSELATIAGSVIFEDRGSSEAEASLQLYSRETGQHLQVSVFPSREFQYPDVHPGHYDVVLQNSDGFVLKSIAALNAKVRGQTVEIGHGLVRLVLLASKATGQVEGVVLRDNKPLAGAMVVLVPQDPINNRPLFRRDQSDSDGTFTLPGVLPGKYTVLAVENGWELEWANPAVLAPYMPKGRVVQIEAGSKLNVTVKSVAAIARAEVSSPSK